MLIEMLFVLAISQQASHQGFTSESNDQGVLIREGGKKVLFYQVASKDRQGKHRRSNYVHPLYSLHGSPLTEDFPADHLHHRGVFWAWHQVRVGTKKLGDPWTCQAFDWKVKVQNVATTRGQATIRATIDWSSPQFKQNGKVVPVIREQFVLTAHRQSGSYRNVDFDISLAALVDGVAIGGAENDKGYGGFSVRAICPPDLKFVDRDRQLAPQRTPVRGGPWLNMTGTFPTTGGSPAKQRAGIAVLCHPTNPGMPQPWILRQRRSMQNPVFPGQHAVPLRQGQPVRLRYRLAIHDGSLTAAQIQANYKDYCAN